jgi:hypothetical protein
MNRYRIGCTLSATAIAAYLLLVVPGQSLRLRYVAVILTVLCVIVWVATKRTTLGTRLKLIAVTVSTLTSLLAVDVGYSFYHSQFTMKRDSRTDQVTAQDAIRALPLREIEGVVVFKANASFSASIVGNLYSFAPPEVLTTRLVSYGIDEHGFRESTPLREADIIAVGDSFTFGDGADSPDIWANKLESLAEQSVYNLGFPGSGPSDSILRLRYAIRIRGNKPSTFVWMLYEGNDFDDEHFAISPMRTQRKHTLTRSALGMIEAVRRDSVISRALSGQLYIGLNTPPVFRSEMHGRRCFHPEDIQSARMESIPELPSVESAFSKLNHLADGSRVIVVIAPTAAQVYGEDFPALKTSQSRPFADWVTERAERNGFDMVDLYPHFLERGQTSMLYYNDDTHWNPSGHSLAARLIADKIREMNSD